MRRELWTACLGAFLAVAVGSCTAIAAAPAKDAAVAARRSPLVGLVERCAPSVVDIRCTKLSSRKGRYYILSGTGTIIHEAGYILTNSHVVMTGGKTVVKLHDGKSYPCREIARERCRDLVLMKIDAGRPLRPMRIGRSNDIMLAESVVVIGNPGGLGQTISTGIVSALGRVTTGRGLVSTMMIQINADIDAGNSGGPLINVLGKMIGVVSASKKAVANAGLATPIDRVREIFPHMVSAEERAGVRLGLEVNVLGAARVAAVAAGSPAEKAGVRAGDIVRRIGKMAVNDGLHYHLALLEQKAGDEVPLEIRRGGKSLTLTATLDEVPPRPPDDAAGLVNGIRYSAYKGEWKKLPDFDKLDPVESGKTDKISHAAYKNGKDHFGLKFEGYIAVPADGLYTFYSTSDNASRVYIGGRLVVDNDGEHSAFEKFGLMRLKAGKHPIKVTFYEGAGREELKVSYKGPTVGEREIPPSALFVKP